jgi:hypothetical protein
VCVGHSDDYDIPNAMRQKENEMQEEEGNKTLTRKEMVKVKLSL